MSDTNIYTSVAVLTLYALVPLYVFATYYFGGASLRKSLFCGLAVFIWQYVVFVFARSPMLLDFNIPATILLVFLVALPPIYVYYDKHFLAFQASQYFLVGLQIFRIIGTIFIVEMSLGHVPAFFALFAGTGDIIVTFIALSTLVFGFIRGKLSLFMVRLLGLFGLFHMMFSFPIGILSSPIPIQIFSIGQPFVIMFPLNLIPIFFLPLAISYHIISLYSSYLDYRKAL